MLSKVFNSVLFGIYVLRNVVALYALGGDVSLWYGINANLTYGEQKPFMSTGHTKSWGFVNDGKKATASVVYNIYCPKGTKGIYTEPYSCYGAMGSSGHTWDGVTKLDVCKEVEVILQRGTKFRVTKAEYKGGKWFIDMEVIEQPVKMPNIP